MKQFLLSLIALLAICTTSQSQTCTPLGNQTTYGTNDIWIGYVYNNSDFTDYAGYVNQGAPNNPFFDQNFGGENVSYSTNGCPVQTESFSIRYKLTRVVPGGTYRISVAGDDGYRFSVDGGATWIINKWATQTYMSTTIDITLSGTINAVLEYYENTGANRLTFAFGAVCVPTENQLTYGTGNIWKGYVYEGTNFNTYKGMVREGTATNFGFDQNFGGAAVTYNTSACPVTTEQFSVRYRLVKSFVAGTYTFILGGDDGYRLSINGGNTWVINNWTAHDYTTSSYNVTLSGSYNLVIEYYGTSGQNRVTFNMLQNGILPVNLISFTGKQQNGGLDLNWKVSDDSNPDLFEIEKSTDGLSFRKIGTEKATSSTTYSFTDAAINAGTSFYRMKMTDLTGAVTYSKVISIRSTGSVSQGINVFPNIITGNSLYMEIAEVTDKAVVIISDVNGRQVNQQLIGRLAKGQISTIETSASKLPAGMYFLQVVDGNESIGVKRFIVK
ncbi:MAG: PA14 domain-containing protein [Chitinophagaceae bacterium]